MITRGMFLKLDNGGITEIIEICPTYNGTEEKAFCDNGKCFYFNNSLDESDQGTRIRFNSDNKTSATIL